MTAEIAVNHLGGEDLVRVFDFLENQGDVLSQLGAIEVGLRILSEKPEIERYIIRLIEKIRDDNVEDSSGGFKTFSRLFILVDGELSRSRLMSEKPPFYRRLASLSQAALIHRQIVSLGADDTFYKQSYINCINQYYMQTFADMRVEPRWNPDFSAALRMKENFLGRIMLAAKLYEQNIRNTDPYNIILGEGPESLQSLCKSLYPFYPGPLEGTGDSAHTSPDGLADMIEAQLSTEKVGTSYFNSLINSSMIFRVNPNQVALAAKALSLASIGLQIWIINHNFSVY